MDYKCVSVWSRRLFVCGFLIVWLNEGHLFAQVSVTNASPSAIIDFSNTMQVSVGSNPSAAFSGVGFESGTTTAGRLNSTAWAITGWSDGDLTFGGTKTTASTDYTRGATATEVGMGGIYAFTAAPHSATNPCLMIQPGGSDFAPGTITLRIQNNGTTSITQFDISYNLFIRNDQGRSNSFNFSYSADNVTYISAATLDYTSTDVPDALGWVQVGSSPSRSTIITGLNIMPGDYFYIRWSGNDVGGSGSRDEFGLDDISITAAFGSCIASSTITSFSPLSGPAGTQVTIIGTGLNNATGVKFGGVNSTIISQTATQLIAEVSSSALSGKVTITEASCTSQSSTDFTFLKQNNNCGTGSFGFELLISEVFDSKSGFLSYIEIFNPTSASINLAAYTIRLVTDGSAITDFPLTGALASGAVGVISIGDPFISGSTICSVSTIQTNISASGFNGNDRVILRKGTIDIDVVDNPSYGGSNPPAGDDKRGFSQLRNAGILNPSATYNSSEWTNADPETCAHLGTAPTALTSNNVTINVHPVTVNCSAVTFSVAATATPGTINYVWRYQAPGSIVWELASQLTTNVSSSILVTGSGTNSIVITGNTALLKDYQFYCEIGSGGSPECIKYSNAAQYTYSTKAYYRTKTSGLWNDVSIWEISDSEGGTYINACQYPVSINSDKVNILSTHTITLSSDITIDWVDINNGAALNIDNASKLTFNNGNSAAADFQVNGTLVDGGSSTNGIDFIFPATWQLASNGVIIKTNGSSTAKYRDSYEGGISTIPSTANWIMRYSGSDVSEATIGMYFPNLTIESTSGLWNPVSTGRFNGGASGYATVKGNLDIGGAGAGTVTVYNENNNATPMQVLGNLIVRTGSTLTNNGTTTGTGFEVKGDITVDGILMVNGAGSSGLLTLSGTNPQAISGAGTISVQDMTINNSSVGLGGGVTLNRALTMGGVLTFTSGLVNTTSANLLTLNSTASCPAGGNSNSFVNGPVQKIGAADFVFPTGKLVNNSTPHYRIISISGLSSSSTFTAEFIRGNARALGSINSPGPPPLQWVSQCEYWKLDRNAGTSNANVTLSWSAQSPCNGLPNTYVTDLPTLVVAHLNTSASVWDSHGHSSVTGDATAGTITWNGVSVFSPFSLGTTDVRYNPLPQPLHLTSFTGTSRKSDILLQWSLLNKDDYHSFIIEKSKNGVEFAELKLINNQPVISGNLYNEADKNPFNGWNYYRIKAFGKEQELKISNIIRVWFGEEDQINISPNPASEKIIIKISDPRSISRIDLVNISGQVLKQAFPSTFSTEINISQLQAGIYYLKIVNKNGLITRPFVKK